MPLHNTEELKAAPTSPIESEVHNEEIGTYEFPEGKQDPQGGLSDHPRSVGS